MVRHLFRGIQKDSARLFWDRKQCMHTTDWDSTGYCILIVRGHEALYTTGAGEEAMQNVFSSI